ncbi:MAG: 3-dehydroquinate synthase, partial [Planctomycetaceae bacterium]|nr:3-dehydroquinate synthase [Planctomycetaceae bacterium]
TLLHGEAVSLGMMAAVRLACSLDLLDQTVVERQQKLLETLGLPVVTPVLNDIDPDDFLKIMARDKKTVGGNLRFVLPDKIGHVEIIDRIDQMLVTSAIKTVCLTT